MKIPALLVLIIICAGCESVVDFPEVSRASEYPVIEALLTNQDEVQKVRVSYSTALDDSVSSRPVTNAQVYVSSDVGDTTVYHYTDGWYVSSPYHAIAGRIYTLTVNIGGVGYKAVGSLIPMNGMDTLYARRMPYVGRDSAYFTYFNAGAVSPTVIRYYQIDVFRNDTLLTGGTNIAVFNDKYLSSLTGVNLPFPFSQNDTAVLKLYSISQAMFDYYQSLSVNIFSLSFVNGGYRGNPPLMFNRFAAGYFQVSAVDEKKLVIR